MGMYERQEKSAYRFWQAQNSKENFQNFCVSNGRCMDKVTQKGQPKRLALNSHKPTSIKPDTEIQACQSAKQR
jgi:hypothetical protein